MRCRFAVLALCLAGAAPALALDLPARKPGLWEVKMTFVGRNIPVQTIRECIDAQTDKLMNSNFSGAAVGQVCSKQELTRSGATLTVDSICTINGATTTSHAVVTGSFDSGYTVDVNSTREGGPPLPGVANGAHTSHMTVAANWLGPCQPGQRPGDMMMGNGITMNVLDLQKRMPPAPQR
jgi:hypothetical protein